MMMMAFVCSPSCKINGWYILASSGSIWQYLALHPQGAKFLLITCVQG